MKHLILALLLSGCAGFEENNPIKATTLFTSEGPYCMIEPRTPAAVVLHPGECN